MVQSLAEAAAFKARLINETKSNGHASEIRRCGNFVTLTCAVAFRIRTSCKRTLIRSHVSNAYTILSKKRSMSGEISKNALTTMATLLSLQHDWSELIRKITNGV